jgi:hypothetical protein
VLHSIDRPLTKLAWLNVMLHLAGLAVAAVGMKPGSLMAPLPDRLAYLASRPLGWTIGWATWILCAIALVAFLAMLTHRLGERASVARLGLTIAIVGAGFDLCCDCTYILVFPMLATDRSTPESLFLVLERIVGIASMVIANGCYAIGILLTTIQLRGRAGTSRLAILVGYAIAVFGLILSAAGFTWVGWHAALATGPTILLFCVWVVLVARGEESPRR